MTRLFLRLYFGVLAVLFVAWYIHGVVSERRARTDRARVFEEAHGGGARLVAEAIDAAPIDDRDQVLHRLRERFEYPVDVIPVARLPGATQRRISSGEDVAYYIDTGNDDEQEVVVVTLAGGLEVVRLGPFRDYGRREVKEAIGGWLRLTADKLRGAATDQRAAVLQKLQQRFEFPVEIARREDLPGTESERLAGGADVVFYQHANDRWFAATPISDGTEVVRCGPFPSFERIEEKAATTTLALVLLPAALAIALLLRPVAQQLRHVENAAKTIAAGDLSARVDERRVRSALPLAQAFNNIT